MITDLMVEGVLGLNYLRILPNSYKMRLLNVSHSSVVRNKEEELLLE